MAKLLRSNFARLWRSRAFWITAAILFAITVFNCFNYDAEYFADMARINPGLTVDDDWTVRYILGYEIFTASAEAMIITSVFVALFFGTDYSSGTIRNKLSVGHSRVSVYLSNLITATVGTLCLIVIYSIPSMFKAIFWGKELGMTTDKFIPFMGTLVFAYIAMAAISTMLGAVVSERPIVATLVVIMTTVVLMLGSSPIIQNLNAPENLIGSIINENGETEEVITLNPFYIKGIKRDILTAITDINPGGQIAHIMIDKPRKPQLYPLYSLGVYTAATVAGTLIFRKKDLK